jgi:squalene-hopene/tetraprenyl-beta-curcumene cyclase
VKTSSLVTAHLTALGVICGLAAAGPRAAADPPSWSPKAAAAYLDERQDWWQKWPGAARDHGTFCVSCHTVATYALARPALRRALGEPSPSAGERSLHENIAKRVMLWRDVEPFYPDQTRGLPKTSESRGTESILNALVLASRDAAAGPLGDDTRRAFENMWALQFTRGDQAGSWAWLNFHYEPWEADGSRYYGAALAAIAAGMAPGGYARSAEIQDRMKLLRDYLAHAADQQHLFNRLTALWASTTWSGRSRSSVGSGELGEAGASRGLQGLDAILSGEQQRAIVDDALRLQQGDGGWSMTALGSWKRVDNTPLDTRTDGYATGLVACVLQAAGDPRAKEPLARALAWLQKNQQPGGLWVASSLNKQRDPASDAARFMSDAATAYAVLALTR